MTTETRKKSLIHEHELVLCDRVTCRDRFNCGVCFQVISDIHYHCSSSRCGFNIHINPCSKLPEYIQHPLHPPHPLFVRSGKQFSFGCDACGNRSFYVYDCLQCSFTLDVKCAFLKPAPEKNGGHQQQPPNHPHPLVLFHRDKDTKYFTYTCWCCSLPFDGPSSSNSSIYACFVCNTLLHKACANLPSKLEHPFHPLHPLTLLFCWPPLDRRGGGGEEGYDPSKNQCGACRNSLRGFTYHCSECGFSLDIPCAFLVPTKNAKDQVRQFSHPHPLILCHNIIHKFLRCYGCGLPMRGVADSICYCVDCKVLLHKTCADLPREIKHVFHPPHILILDLHHLSKRCGACDHYCLGFAFRCSQCEFYLDVNCALSKPITIMSKIHYHPLAFLEKENFQFSCKSCSKLNDIAKPCNTPFFRWVPCNFNLHVKCVSTLPPLINSKKHLHPLTLTDSPIKDYADEDDDAEFYCDSCEERRALADSTYFCAECHYVAHIHCLAYEIMHILEEDWSKSQGGADEVEELTSSTLKDFLDSFTRNENKEVQTVLEACRRDIGGHNGDNSKDEASKHVRKMLVSRINQVTMLPWENWTSTSKVIKVDKYVIIENLAPILETLLGKYGDFSGTSTLSRKAKMLFIMTVCDATHSMCNTKVLEITTDLLLSWFYSFVLCKRAGFEVRFAFDRLMRAVRAHFGLQAIDSVPVDPSLAGLDSEKLAIIGQADEQNDKLERSMQLSNIKLDAEIEEFEKQLEQMRELRKWKEACLRDVLEVEGQMAADIGQL